MLMRKNGRQRGHVNEDDRRVGKFTLIRTRNKIVNRNCMDMHQLAWTNRTLLNDSFINLELCVISLAGVQWFALFIRLLFMKMRLISRGRGGGTPLYTLYRYEPFWSENGYRFSPLWF